MDWPPSGTPSYRWRGCAPAAGIMKKRVFVKKNRVFSTLWIHQYYGGIFRSFWGGPIAPGPRVLFPLGKWTPQRGPGDLCDRRSPSALRLRSGCGRRGPWALPLRSGCGRRSPSALRLRSGCGTAHFLPFPFKN